MNRFDIPLRCALLRDERKQTPAPGDVFKILINQHLGWCVDISGFISVGLELPKVLNG